MTAPKTARSGPRRRITTTVAIVLAAASALAGCSSAVEPLPQEAFETIDPDQVHRVPLPPGAYIEPASAQQAEDPNVETPLGTLRPDEATAAERVPGVLQRGHLIVGVDQSQNLLAFRNPTTGELEGFEIDLAREVARDIFGNPDAIDFRFVDSDSRVDALADGRVDIVVRTMTVTRKRQEEVAFSRPYMASHARLLAPASSGITDTADLVGRTVCTAAESTNVSTARLNAPESDLLLVRNWSDCLMALQQHQADAILSDDTILAGIAAQDPSTRIVGPNLTSEAYAIGVALPTPERDTTGMVRQVNLTLERIIRDGTWLKLYDRWLSNNLIGGWPPEPAYQEEATSE